MSPIDVQAPITMSDSSQPGVPSKRRLFRRMADWILQHQGTPHSLALGFAIGMFVALTPTVGIQMVLGGLIAHIFKGNRTIAAGLAWITNPLTIGPIYYFNYRVGLLFLPGDEQAGRAFIDSISNAKLTDPSSLWHALTLTGHQLWGVAGVLWVGSLIVAAIAAAVSYPLVKHLVIAERKKLQETSEHAILPPSSEDTSA